MIRTIAALLCLGTASGAAAASISDGFRDNGLSATIEALEALPDPTEEEMFSLGAAHFLRGIERALQTRYRHGMTGRTLDFPVLRLRMPANPTPEPFRPDLVRTLFADLIDDMARADAALARIGDVEFGAEIYLGDLWFDIDGDGRLSEGEHVVTQLNTTLLGARNRRDFAMVAPPEIRFDRADATWLQAYTHLLSAVGETVLAFDPTEAIAEVTADAATIRNMASLRPSPGTLPDLFADEVDMFVILLRAIEQQPDRDRIHSARDHLLDMIRLNRTTWDRIATETDNDREWLPGPKQVSALGIPMQPRTGDVWLSVLDDAEALLTGRKLMPHWRFFRETTGINLGRMLDDPIPVDLPGIIQGGALLPFAEEGERVSTANWWQFERMVRGDALMFVLYLN